MGLKQTKAQKLPDSVPTLLRLADEGVMVQTPAQDYDDSYCLDYARRQNAYIVSNDKFRDFLSKIELNPGQNKAEQLRAAKSWLQTHTVSFAFK